jgi:hypothetical protein
MRNSRQPLSCVLMPCRPSLGSGALGRAPPTHACSRREGRPWHEQDMKPWSTYSLLLRTVPRRGRSPPRLSLRRGYAGGLSRASHVSHALMHLKGKQQRKFLTWLATGPRAGTGPTGTPSPPSPFRASRSMPATATSSSVVIGRPPRSVSFGSGVATRAVASVAARRVGVESMVF